MTVNVSSKLELKPKLRPARSSDLAALADLVNYEILNGTASWTDKPHTQEYMANWIVERTGSGFPVFVAELDEVVGVASYSSFRKGDGYRHTVEHSIYVAPKARRQGIATALISRLIDQAVADGHHRMIGCISSDQEASIRLHKDLGFKEVGRLTEVGRKFDRWLDLVMMMRNL
ncbi:N-acetyltransferase [Rhodobacteraceae bacterium NNCM2]|nr:N-acetyltransferase [Coraliihabitans acroporae]